MLLELDAFQMKFLPAQSYPWNIVNGLSSHQMVEFTSNGFGHSEENNVILVQ